jgi:hypothetical protein
MSLNEFGSSMPYTILLILSKMDYVTDALEAEAVPDAWLGENVGWLGRIGFDLAP